MQKETKTKSSIQMNRCETDQPKGDQKTNGSRTDTREKLPTLKLQPLAGQRQLGESEAAICACNDWLHLGAGRTLRRLLAYYTAQNYTGLHRNTPESAVSVENWCKSPTLSLDSLKHWSTTFSWQERAKTFDGQVYEIHNAHRRRAMESGFALEYVRINSLKRLAARLEQEISEKGVFLLVEMIGKDGTVGTEEKYNSALVNDYLKVLADIAKEMGHRHRNSYLDTVVAQVERELDADKIDLAQMERMARGEHFIGVLLEPYLKTD